MPCEKENERLLGLLLPALLLLTVETEKRCPNGLGLERDDVPWGGGGARKGGSVRTPLL